MDRSVKLLLHTTPAQDAALHETTRQFTAAFNLVCRTGWEQQQSNGVKLHHATYRAAKQSCPGLVSDLIIQARVKATETVKSALTWQTHQIASYPKRVAKARKRGKPDPLFKPVRMPQSKHCPPRYNLHTYTLYWDSQTVRMSTTTGRMSIPFSLPHANAVYIGHPVATADLCYRKGRFYLHVVVQVPAVAIPPTESVVGVDLGLNRPAVTSERAFLGRKRWKEVDRRRFRLTRKLQSNGSKSAKRHLKKLAGRGLRFHRDCDHVLSKRIVQRAAPGSTIVLENLTNIRGRSEIGGQTKRRLHSWSFAQLYGFIRYKAEDSGIRVVRVDPRHTSQTCSRCGYQARNNRRSQALFKCRHCAYSLNADLNAAINIREKYRTSLAGVGTPASAGGPVKPPIVSDPVGDRGTNPAL
jgi:IS605 OrfB family transposase